MWTSSFLGQPEEDILQRVLFFVHGNQRTVLSRERLENLFPDIRIFIRLNYGFCDSRISG